MTRRKRRHDRPTRQARTSPETRAIVGEFMRSVGPWKDAYLEGLRIAFPYADALGDKGVPDAEITRFLIYVGTYGLDALYGDGVSHVFFATPNCGEEMCMSPDHQVLTNDESEAVLSPKRKIFMHDLIWVRGLGREIPDGFMVTHSNGDVLDNRSANLVLAPVPDGLVFPPDGASTFVDADECTDLPSYPVTRSQVLEWEVEN